MTPALLGMTVVMFLSGEPITPWVSAPEAHGSLRSSGAPGQQHGAHVATLGSTSMVVWTDERGGVDHWATRLELDGRLPDEFGRRLPTSGPVAASTIAAGPGGWWRAWSEGTSPPYAMYGQLLEADGTPIGDPIPLGPPTKSTVPFATWSGQEYVTVWADLARPELVGARVTPDGNMQTVVMSTPTAVDSAAVACGGGVCLAVFESPSPPPVSRDVRGRFFDPATLQFVTNELTISSTPNNELFPVVAYEPSTGVFVVAWREAAGSDDVHVAAVRSDGSITGPVPLEQTGSNEVEPSVSCRADGANLCAVAFRSGGGEIHLWRLRGDLSLVDATPQVFPGLNGSVAAPSVSLAPGGGALVWHGRGIGFANGDDVHGVPLDGSGTALGPPVVLGAAASGQELPAVAAGVDTSWLFWRDNGRGAVPGDYQVSVGGFARWGVDDHNVSQGAESGDRGAIAPFGQEAVAVWGDDGPSVHLGFARIDKGGGLHDFGVAMSASGAGGCRGPAAVAAGDVVAIAVPCSGPVLWATAYTSEGFIPEVAISDLGSIITSPALATDGQQVWLAWSGNRDGPLAIYGTRLDRDQGSLDGKGVALAATGGDQTKPAIAYTEGTWLVAWQDSSGAAGARVLGIRFNADGDRLDAAALVLHEAERQAAAPRLLSVPGGFLLAWEEGTNRGDVRAALVSLAGTVGQPFDISASEEWEGQVSLARGGTESEVVAAYSAMDMSPAVASRRVYTRLIDLDGPPKDPLGIGCDCSSGGGGTLWQGALLLVLGAAARVRRGRSAPRP